MAEAKALTQSVRVALTHLYDMAFLQTHHLSLLLDQERTLDAVTRAQRLRRALLDCIESLRPLTPERTATSAQSRADSARAHTILTSRYVDGLSMEEIAAELGLSVRQIYREHERGLAAVTSLFVEKYLPHVSDLPAPSSDDLVLAQTEAERLSQASHPAALDISELIDDVAEMLRLLNSHLEIHTALHAKSLPAVWADRVMLRQALINLLTHAARTNTTIQLAVQWNDETLGIHIALDPSALEGMPVEVAIARSLIEAQRGALHIGAAVASHIPTYTEAVIHLPLAQPQQRLLVIDDNSDLVALFRRYLGAHQINVIGLTDSTQAISTAETLSPHLITLDVMMPNLDGWDLLRRLRQNPRTQNIPVVVCSVLREEPLATALGANGYLIKPVQKADFLAMTQRWLGTLLPS